MVGGSTGGGCTGGWVGSPVEVVGKQARLTTRISPISSKNGLNTIGFMVSPPGKYRTRIYLPSIAQRDNIMQEKSTTGLR
jgi:hypothetical protein